MKYKIVLKTDFWHAARHAQFNGHTSVVAVDNLTLKEAQDTLLVMFNTDYERCYCNWGLARCNHSFYTSTFSDGTRSYNYDYYTVSIEKEDNDE